MKIPEDFELTPYKENNRTYLLILFNIVNLSLFYNEIVTCAQNNNQGYFVFEDTFQNIPYRAHVTFLDTEWLHCNIPLGYVGGIYYYDTGIFFISNVNHSNIIVLTSGNITILHRKHY